MFNIKNLLLSIVTFLACIYFIFKLIKYGTLPSAQIALLIVCASLFIAFIRRIRDVD